MNATQKKIASAIYAVVALGLASAGAGHAASPDMEKCAGIVKAGKNDCGTSKSSCAALRRSMAIKRPGLPCLKALATKLSAVRY